MMNSMIRKRFASSNDKITTKTVSSSPKKNKSFIGELNEEADQSFEKKLIKMIRRNLISIIISLIILILLFIFIVIPIIVRNSITFQRFGVFMNIINVHYFHDLSNTEQFGLRCAKPFRIETTNDEGSINLGAWHIFPHDDYDECKREAHDFNDDRIIVLYLHGNMASRAFYHRRLLYNLLSEKSNAHVIAFDYRGYADSTNAIPSTFGLTNDTRNVYEWILGNNVTSDRIIIWGHSLGTGVATRFLSECPDEIYPLAAVIESGFTSIVEASHHYPLIRLFSFLPYFEYCFVEPLVNNPELNFNSTAQLSTIRCPLLILHAEDDVIVSFDLGRKLYEQAKMLQPKNVSEQTQFVSYPAQYGYGHQDIYRDPDLCKTVNNFFKSLKQI
ncbi:lysophosphatidylserine lipase ABHD12 [Dermatophagoides pteronyssinus]|uniref:lysophosphatidylserine lipase ABHD12 n=1 Tax=Dermatophagoides pteronyssinus TaxID=6956 RepID=UPI003F6737E4